MTQYLPYYSLNPIPAIEEHVKIVGIKKLKTCSRCNKQLVFISDFPVPFLYNTNTEHCIDFRLDNAPSSPLTSVDISVDMNFVLTGHENGNVSLWSIQNLKLIKTFHTKVNSEVVFIRFGWNSQEFYVGYETGEVTYFQIRNLMGFYNLSETPLKLSNNNDNSKETVTNIITMKNGYPFNVVFISWTHSYMILNGETLQITAKSDEYPSEISIDHYADEEKIILTISHENNFQMLCFTGPKTFTSICEHKLHTGTIVISEFLVSGLFIAITDGGEMTVVAFDGKIAQQIEANDLYEASKPEVSPWLQPFDDQLIILQPTKCFIVDFLNWKDKLNNLAEAGNYDDAFRLIIEIDAGLAKDLVGVPHNSTELRIQLQEKTQDIVTKYLNHVLCKNSYPDNELPDETLKEIVLSVVACLSSLKMTSILLIAADLFKMVGKSDIFFKSTLESSISQNGNLTQRVAALLTPEFIEEYIKFELEMNDKDELKNAEKQLVKANLDPTYAKGLLTVAEKYELISLEKKILVEFMNDYITPCELYKKNNRLIIYLNEVFSDPKYKIAGRRAVALWILYPFNNFERLRDLFSENTIESSSDDIAFIAESLISICPNDNKDNFPTVKQCVYSILYAISELKYSQVHKILNAIIPAFKKYDLQYAPTTALPLMLRYLLTSNESTQEREYVLMSYIKQYPQLFLNTENGNNNTAIRMVCEANGFVNIAKDLFLKEKNYSTIIASFLSNQYLNNTVFDFINNHLDDTNELSEGIKKNIQGLISLNANQIVRIIWTSFMTGPSNLCDHFIKNLTNKTKYLYLKALYEIAGDNAFNNERLNNDYFELLCQNDPDEAVNFLKDRIDHDMGSENGQISINRDEAKKCAEKYHRIDCIIRILIANNNLEGALIQITEAVENSLLNYIDNDQLNSYVVKSIDDLNEAQFIKRQMQTVNIAISLLKELANDQVNHDTTQKVDPNIVMQWQTIFKAFKFPLYRVSIIQPKQENKVFTMAMIFSYFCINSMTIIEAENLFRILVIHFSGLDEEIYHTVLSFIFNRLDYQKRLNSVVEKILIKDAANIRVKVFSKANSGVQTNDPICAICHEPISNSYSMVKVFSCGHCFHENEKCGFHESCPICSGNTKEESNHEHQIAADKIITINARQLDRKMRRFNQMLQQNYNQAGNSNNSDYGNAYSDAHIFFGSPEAISDPPDPSKFPFNGEFVSFNEVYYEIFDPDYLDRRPKA